MKKLSVLTLLLLFVSINLHPVKKDTKLILDELEKIQKSVFQLESTLKQLNTEVTGMNKQLSVLDNKITAVTTNLAGDGQNRETVLLSLQFMKEELNEVRNLLGKINERLMAMPVRSEGSNAVTEDHSDSISQSPDSLYFTAYSDYNKKNYDLAIEGFTQFVKQFPDNVLADNSLYWIGECYYAQKKYSEAIRFFSEITEKYQGGDKIPDALLKKGYALIESGQVENGISVLKELISSFPLSEEAYLAQQKIKDIRD